MRVSVIGAGYVGLVSAVGLAELGHEVVVIERLATRRQAVLAGRAPFHEPGLDDALAAVLRSGHLTVSADMAPVVATEIVIVAVGTPSIDGRIDLTAVLECAAEIARLTARASHPPVMVIRSTVIPGTCDGPVRACIEAARPNAVVSLPICANPEFLREGTALNDFRTPDRIVVGSSDPAAAERVVRLYAGLDSHRIITTSRTAEMIKYTSNALLATLISFSNEISALCERIDGVDVVDVLDAVHLDRRWSAPGATRAIDMLSYLRAGGGFGGSCLPKDVEALASLGADLGAEPRLLEAVLYRNRSRPHHLVELVDNALHGLRGRTVTVLGLAFKPGTDDLRRSPSIDLVNALAAAGASVIAHDPMAAKEARSMLADDITVTDVLDEAVAATDAVVLMTAWPEYREIPWDRVLPDQPVVLVDGRNALRGTRFPPRVTYLPIGRLAPISEGALS